MMKNTEEYDTHKVYDVEEFIFDDVIKKTVIELLSKFRDDFKPHGTNKFSTMDNVVWIQAIPLLEELKYYYNNDICISTATSIAIAKNSKYNLRTFSFYYENALFRISNAWDYVHIILNQILGTDFIVGEDIRERIINAKCHDIKFVKHKRGYRPVVKPLNDDEKKAAMDIAEKENKLLMISANQKKSKFHRFLRKERAINERLQNIFDIFYSDDVNEFIKLRNEVVHRRPLGAKYSVSPDNIFIGQCISIDPCGWYKYHDSEALLEKNIYALREVIGELLDIVFNNDLPNAKNNEGKHFYMKPFFCNDCKKTIVLPDVTVDYFQLHNLKLLCPYCETNNLSVLDEEKSEVSDSFYLRHLIHYNEIIYKHKDLVFNEKEPD